MESSRVWTASETSDSTSSTRKCFDCKKSFKSCECKNCSKCGVGFRRYWGTSVIKGRSHCRMCLAAVCITCHVVANNALKICARCLIRQKEEELSTQKAMSAIEQARTGRTESTSSVRSDTFVIVSGVSLLTPEQKKESLFEAAKTGDHYSMVTLLNGDVDVNLRDANKNTPLFFAAEGGHLPCVALLMERNADVTAVNNKSWTPLHALAWKGSTDSHVECGELLIETFFGLCLSLEFLPHGRLLKRGGIRTFDEPKEHLMGAAIFNLTDTLETAADLAARCGGKQELVQLLRAAEDKEQVYRIVASYDSAIGISIVNVFELFDRRTAVDIAVHELQERLKDSSGLNPRDPMLKLYIAALVRHITENLSPTSPKRNTKGNESSAVIKTPELLRPTDLTRSLDRGLRINNSSDEVKAETPSNMTRIFGNGTPSSNIPKADVEPIIRSDLFPAFVTNPTKLEEKFNKCQAEKVDLEKRCKRLMQSIASAAEAHEKELTRLQHEIDVAREQKEIALKRCEATFVNKMAKIRQETEATVHEANERLQQAEKDRSELLHLQNTLRLSWVPDEFVNYCSNNKCRAPFTQTRRRHHCRCCGRVFCNNCTLQSVSLPVYGYHQPVRVCNPCFALVDDMFSEQPLSPSHVPST